MPQIRGARMRAPMSAPLVAGCSKSEPAVEWREYPSASGAYSAQFPAKPKQESEELPGVSAAIDLVTAEHEGDFYAITEFTLPKGAQLDLDGAVDGAINGGIQRLEQETGENGTATEVSRETGTFENAETREVVADLSAGNDKARYRALMFAQDGMFVQVITVDEGDDAEADVTRFLESFE